MDFLVKEQRIWEKAHPEIDPAQPKNRIPRLETQRDQISKLTIDDFVLAVPGPMKINPPEDDYETAREALRSAAFHPITQPELDKLQKNFGRLYFEAIQRKQKCLEWFEEEIEKEKKKS